VLMLSAARTTVPPDPMNVSEFFCDSVMCFDREISQVLRIHNPITSPKHLLRIMNSADLLLVVPFCGTKDLHEMFLSPLAILFSSCLQRKHQSLYSKLLSNIKPSSIIIPYLRVIVYRTAPTNFYLLNSPKFIRNTQTHLLIVKPMVKRHW